MQIHDLNTKALTDPAYVAFDDGTDTYKADFKAEIDNAAADAVADADLTDNTVAFTSGDAASPTAWTAVDVLTSGLTIKALFNRISTMIKNVRWLYSKLGTTDISSIGGGTVTGAISSLNSKYITQRYSGNFGALSAGASGYITASITIPAGYITTGIANVVIGHPGAAAGLSISTGCASGLSGTVTFYPSYYTPKAIANGNADFNIYILCVKDA